MTSIGTRIVLAPHQLSLKAPWPRYALGGRMRRSFARVRSMTQIETSASHTATVATPTAIVLSIFFMFGCSLCFRASRHRGDLIARQCLANPVGRIFEGSQY